MAPFLGPTLGPLVGAYIIAQYDNNWKYAIWVILMICAPVAVAILFMQETSKSRILYLKAKNSGRVLSVENNVPVWKKIGEAILRPLHMCFLEVSFLSHSL